MNDGHKGKAGRTGPGHRSRFHLSWLAGLAGAVLASGCASSSKQHDFDVVVARFYIETPAQDPQAEVVVLPISRVPVPVAPRVVLSEIDYTNVELVKVDLGLCLLFEFNADAARGLYRLTASNLGRRLVIKLNGQPFGARVIDGPIKDGRLFIFLELPDETLAREAVNLKRTSLEVVQPAAARNKGK